MAASVQTTNLGPLVSFTTSAVASSTPVHVYIDSNGTFTAAGTVALSGTVAASGTLTNTGTINSTGGVYLSRNTTGSYTSLTLAAGEFAIDQISAASAVLIFRSGVTIYEFIADTGAVK